MSGEFKCCCFPLPSRKGKAGSESGSTAKPPKKAASQEMPPPSKEVKEENLTLEEILLLPAKRFKYKELEHATNNFNAARVIGKGGFGEVYMGKVSLGKTGKGLVRVAIKKLNPESIQGHEQWVNEVLLLERLRHPNLVHLIGYSSEQGEALLVYMLYPHGSLDKALFHKDVTDTAEVTIIGPAPGLADEPELSTVEREGTKHKAVVLTWQVRLRVARDAARGLAYLHNENLIHRDFKPSNILLAGSSVGPDEPMAVLTDVGLARSGPDSMDSHISTRIMGTLGYLDPLYLETGRLSYKSDTFGFGVMLLELLTGRREGTDRLLTSWVRQWADSMSEDELEEQMDKRLEGKYSRSDAVKVAHIAVKCIASDQNERPEMPDVEEDLSELIANCTDPSATG